jgi:hypothetical protein
MNKSWTTFVASLRAEAEEDYQCLAARLLNALAGYMHERFHAEDVEMLYDLLDEPTVGAAIVAEKEARITTRADVAAAVDAVTRAARPEAQPLPVEEAPESEAPVSETLRG